MEIKYLDGWRLQRGIMVGAKAVSSKREILNRINFFPIPDKDTGTNLNTTFRDILKQIGGGDGNSIHEMSQKLAEGAILGAQGNSGAILAHFFQSLAQTLAGEIRVTTVIFGQAVQRAAQQLAEYITAPVTGTLLTVIQDWAQSFHRHSQASADFAIVLKKALTDAQSSLAATRYQIEILRRKRVVDAGAQGFVYLLEGMMQFIEHGVLREAWRTARQEPQSLTQAILPKLTAPMPTPYCVDCVVSIRKKHQAALNDALKSLCENLAIAPSRNQAQIHLHTDQPEKVQACLQTWGRIHAWQVTDLRQFQQLAQTTEKKRTIALVTDSSCDLSHSLQIQHQVHTVPVRIHFGETMHIDKVTISPLEFYHQLQHSKIHPTTSQPSPGDFKEMYEYLAQRYSNILSIHLADKLSGTFRAAQTAAKYLKNVQIKLIDSKTTSIALGMIVARAGELIAAEKPLEEIITQVNELVEKMKIIINIPNLKYLVKGGRVSKTKGLLANVLHIKPLLTFDVTGKIAECGKALNTLQALKKTVRMVQTGVKDLKNIHIGIVHANAIEKAEWFVRQLQNVPQLHSIMVLDVAPVLGVHAGPGTVGVAFWGE